MRPITLTVGPLASAVANNICTSQTPNGGTVVVLNGTTATNTFQGTGSISGNVLTITAVTSGVVNLRDLISGVGVQANTYVMGRLGTTTNGIGTYVVSVSQSVSSTTIYSNAVATLDTPRRVLLTPAGNESSNTFTITGTGWNNDPVTEVLAGGNATATYTAMDFATVTQIVATNTAASTLTVGTNGVASSRWMRMDDFAFAPNSAQVTVTGSATYSIEQNSQVESTSNLQPYQLSWISAGAIGATTSAIYPFAYSPMRVRVTLSSGSGSASATFVQSAAVPQ